MIGAVDCYMTAALPAVPFAELVVWLLLNVRVALDAESPAEQDLQLAVG